MAANAEIARWLDAVPGILEMHHVGSTSVPGLVAKPVIDLLSVFASEHGADSARSDVEALGYEWLGSYGLPGRRYCRRDDPETGRRLVQVHAYAQGHADIARHLAFRNWLRGNEDHRDAYAAEKTRCAALHPNDRSAYGVCKAAWIDAAEDRALRERWDRR